MTQTRKAQLRRTFSPSALFVLTLFLALFFGLVREVELDENVQHHQVDQYYQFFVHVMFMIFVGFGFLMTFMRRYAWSAVGLNFFMSVMVFLEAILVVGMCQQVIWNAKDYRIRVHFPLLIDAAFCAGSSMIAYGGIIGKATPTQLFWILFAQVPMYALNQRLCVDVIKALDMGGSLVIHMFGAYYGLAVSYMLSGKQPMHGPEHPKNAGSNMNDLFAMIGTLLLWLYWPSFNSSLASMEGGHALTDAHHAWQFVAIINTVMSLMGSAFAAFIVSSIVGGNFNMVHIQNSTLAGGVAIGSACTLRMTPGGALFTGVAAGTLSVLGYEYVSPYLDRTISLRDTCGIHNLHGMPSILGVLVSAFAALGQEQGYLLVSSGGQQFGHQILALLVTLALSITWGLIIGSLASKFNPTNAPPLMPVELFDDGAWWSHQHVEPLTEDSDGSHHHHHGDAGDVGDAAPLLPAQAGAQAQAVPVSGSGLEVWGQGAQGHGQGQSAAANLLHSYSEVERISTGSYQSGGVQLNERRSLV